MRTQTKILLAVVVALTTLIAWRMMGPDFYRDGPDATPFTPPYDWYYPIWMAIYGSAVTVLLSFRSGKAMFFGSVAAVGFGVALFALLLVTVMHSHPVHSDLILIVLCTLLLLVFYSGYSFAMWRSMMVENVGNG